MTDPLSDALPMPSDVRREADRANTAAAADPASAPLEPPSVKLIVRLFVIPLIIVAAAVGIMFLISLMAGGTMSRQEALKLLGEGGGDRTAGVLLGPGSKQRYMAAKALVDQMKGGMGEQERIELSRALIDIIRHKTTEDEGEIRHLLLLALGRTWQRGPNDPPMDSPAATESRREVFQTLTSYANDKEVATRKAALLAMVYHLAGTPEAREALPLLIAKLSDANEDLDVRLAAATALGPLATPEDREAIAALQAARRQEDDRNAELEWSAALSLAQLNQPDVAPTILKLLSREELAGMRYYDRESDPQNPALRTLNDQEQQRILINTMLGARHLQVPEVQQRLRELADNDPSPRVRAAGREILSGSKSAPPMPE